MPWHCCLLELSVVFAYPWWVAQDCRMPRGRLLHWHHRSLLSPPEVKIPDNLFIPISPGILKTELSSQRAWCQPKACGRLWSGLSNSPLWHWILCIYLQPQGAISARQSLQLYQGFFDLAALKCIFPGFTLGSSEVRSAGLRWVCMRSRHLKEILCTLEFEDHL